MDFEFACYSNEPMSTSTAAPLADAHAHGPVTPILYLGLTALGGALFLPGQYQEYFGITHPGLTKEGLDFGGSHYATTFYCITSFHGFHVFSGTIYILITLFRTIANKTTPGDI